MKYNELCMLMKSLERIKSWEQYIKILHKINKFVKGCKQ